MGYIKTMTPYAKKASDMLDGRLHWTVILAQWVHETGFGRSQAVKEHNNHAGIKSNSSGRDYDGGLYAGYNSTDSFVRDYVRTMNLSYYNKVRGDIDNQITELHKSPWATDPAYGSKLQRVYNNLNFDTVASSPVADLTDSLGGMVDGLGDSDMKKYAMVGLSVAVILSILK